MAEYGYAGEILKVDLSIGKIMREATSDYAARFVGGRGFAAKLYWDMVPDNARALEPENCLIYATGPATGFSGIAGCRWQICGKSPAHDPEAFSYANLGGKWGPALKSAGFDALAVQGKADKPVYLYIHDGLAEIRDASILWGQSTFDTIDSIRSEIGREVSVVTTGPAGENRVVFATALADEGASGGSGFGGVMGSKNLKAVAVAGEKTPMAADQDGLHQIIHRIKELKGHGPVRPSPWAVPGVTYTEECYGCGIGCARQVYKAEKDRKYKAFCQQAGLYSKAALDYFGTWNEVQLKAVRFCDAYSLDSAMMAPLILWLIDCFREGLIDERQTGLPLSQAGGPEFIEKLTAKIASREGFGDVLAQGMVVAARSIGHQAVTLMDRQIATRSCEAKDYDPRLFLTTAIFYATEPRRPINQLHGVSMVLLTWLLGVRGMPGAFFTTEDFREAASRYWGSTAAADFSTYEGKALAAKKIQDRCYAKESLILCDLAWPLMSVNHPADHVGDPTMESRIYSAITGVETDELELAGIGERICNLQRAIHLRQGWGGRREDRILDYYHDEPLKQGDVFFDPDAIMPGPEGACISKLGFKVDRDDFERLKTQYYCLRGWGIDTGFPTSSRLAELGLSDVAGTLAERNLLGDNG
ncbi:MAG: aldehyde ferredoxin oxidoreductase N-terminal domain-containing protein [Syntrophorhabdales bacterium]|jgi:aldehyde:ferredoxin oxidoreductase